MGDRDRTATQALVVIAAVVALAGLYIAKPVLAPMLLALVGGVVLSPLLDLWERLGLGRLGAALVNLILALMLLGGLVWLLQPVVLSIIEQAPKVLADMQDALRGLSDMVRGLRDATQSMTEVISEEPGATAGAAAPAGSVAMPSVTDAILLAPAILGQVVIFAAVLFFFMFTRHDVYHAAATGLSVTDDPTQIVARLRRAERHVARYFLTVATINAVLGVVTGFALQMWGLPDALLWGAVAGLMNFVPYIGPAAVAVMLLFAGVAAFDGAMSLAPALTFASLNFFEGQFVTPAFVGRQMAVNPLLVFVSLVFGMWLWGPVGGIVTLPLVIWVMILRDPRLLRPDPDDPALSAAPDKAGDGG